MKSYPIIGIRPIIDARRLGIRDELEGKTASMAQAAMKLISEHAFYSDGTRAKCVIADTSISGSEEAAKCQEKFRRANVVATLSVTPSWCYPMETIDIDPLTIKAIWGFNGTERPGAVYLAFRYFQFMAGMFRTWEMILFLKMLPKRFFALRSAPSLSVR